MGKGSVKERRRSCTNIEGLQESLRPWVTSVNFVAYTHDRSLRLQNICFLEGGVCQPKNQQNPECYDVSRFQYQVHQAERCDQDDRLLAPFAAHPEGGPHLEFLPQDNPLGFDGNQ